MSWLDEHHCKNCNKDVLPDEERDWKEGKTHKYCPNCGCRTDD